jgi:uncharacterized membrane protein
MKNEHAPSRGPLIASAVAALFAAGLAAASLTEAAEAADQAHCYGINACKGKGDCGGKSHSCAGENACKGKGYLKLDKETCLKIQGARLTEEPEKPVSKRQKKS